MNMLRQLFGKDVLRDFWHWFAKHQARFYHFEKEQDKLFAALSKKLHEIHESLTFEFGPIHENGTRELTISANGIRDAFPFVAQLVDRAPKIEKWQINAFRQRIPADDLAIQLGDEIKLGYDDIFFRHRLDGPMIDLDLHIRHFEDSEPFKGAVFILLDALLGEYDIEMKVGRIDFRALEEPPADDLRPLIQLRPLVDKTSPL